MLGSWLLLCPAQELKFMAPFFPNKRLGKGKGKASSVGRAQEPSGARLGTPRACATALALSPSEELQSQHIPVTTRRRRLPHVYPEGRPLFLTWYLHGSVPPGRYPPPGKLNSGRAFVWMDRYLDTVRTGPHYLRQPRVAELVVDALRRGDQELHHYELLSYVVMSNHVHTLVTPKTPPTAFLRSLKSFTARMANKLLGRVGQPFWQRESYDHWIRNGREMSRVTAYIENNPVKAGLVTDPRDYPWSSAAGKG